MAEMLWDPTLNPEVLVSEFIDGYYGNAAPFVRLYMDTMHAAVDETGHFLRACCVQPPTGIHKSYLTPMALLESATAFNEAASALSKPADAEQRARVERASMAITYVFLWRWDEMKQFANNISYEWPLADNQQAAFDSFSRIFNLTGTQHLTSGTAHTPAGVTGAASLVWLHAQVFEDTACCWGAHPKPVKDQPFYAQVVLDECSTSSNTTNCQLAQLWTAAVPADTPHEIVLQSSLSTEGSCLALDVPGFCHPAWCAVVVFRNRTGTCASSVQNTFAYDSGTLAIRKGFTTPTCSSKDGCCIQAASLSEGKAPNGEEGVYTALKTAACDPKNALQQFEIESLGDGKPGRIRDKASGRCLSVACTSALAWEQAKQQATVPSSNNSSSTNPPMKLDDDDSALPPQNGSQYLLHQHAYYKLMSSDLTNASWPAGFTQYSLFVANPGMTAAEINRVRATVPGSKVLAYSDQSWAYIGTGCSEGNSAFTKYFQPHWAVTDLHTGLPVCPFGASPTPLDPSPKITPVAASCEVQVEARAASFVSTTMSTIGNMLADALGSGGVSGPKTNLPLWQKTLRHPAMVAGTKNQSANWVGA